MKNALKLLRRMVLGLLGVMVLLPVVNILILMFTLWDVHGNGGPYSLAQETADALTKDGSGYHLRTDVQERLKEEGRLGGSAGSIRNSGMADRKSAC